MKELKGLSVLAFISFTMIGACSTTSDLNSRSVGSKPPPDVNPTHNRLMAKAATHLSKCELGAAIKVVKSIRESELSFDPSSSGYGCYQESRGYPKGKMVKFMELASKEIRSHLEKCEAFPKTTNSEMKGYQRCLNEMSLLSVPLEKFTFGNVIEYDQFRDKKYIEIKDENLPACGFKKVMTACVREPWETALAANQKAWELKQAEKLKKGICQALEAGNIQKEQLSAQLKTLEAIPVKSAENRIKLESQKAGIQAALANSDARTMAGVAPHVQKWEEATGKGWNSETCQ